MNEKYIQILGIILTAMGFVIVIFLYWAEPKTLEEVSSKALTTIENVETKGQVLIGTYQIDKNEFERGLTDFYGDAFVVARDDFQRADPEKRDANTQFYIAYSYYLQGWGKFYNDDALFNAGLESVNRVIMLDPEFRSTDERLGMKTPAELKHELEEGVRITVSDFNPMRIFRERK